MNFVDIAKVDTWQTVQLQNTLGLNIRIVLLEAIKRK